MNADLLAALEKVAGLTKAEASSTAASFKGWGYDLVLVQAYQGDGNDLVQSDDQLHTMIKLLRKLTPMKNSDRAYELFRHLSLEHGYRINLPKGPLPVVP
jgi:hypothetical protein